MLQQPLASLPKAFGFEDMVTKGHFSHNFHTSENIDYEGELPDLHYFGTDYMKPTQIKELKRWHREERNRLAAHNLKYNLKNELIKYCENDVLILLNCVEMFRKIYKTVTGIDPITRCFTLDSMGLDF